MSTRAIQQRNHQAYEDAAALVIGSLLVSFGVALFTKASLLTGSMAGLSLLIQYSTDYNFGPVFWTLNAPFYLLSLKIMGGAFTTRTFLAVSLVAIQSHFVSQWLHIAEFNYMYVTILGACVQGVGFVIIFRHRSGLGGINILAIYLQERFGWRAGYIQLFVDALIFVAAYIIMPVQNLVLSASAALITNVIIGMNHRPGRYTGIS